MCHCYQNTIIICDDHHKCKVENNHIIQNTNYDKTLFELLVNSPEKVNDVTVKFRSDWQCCEWNATCTLIFEFFAYINNDVSTYTVVCKDKTNTSFTYHLSEIVGYNRSIGW
jgi:hypothetical protein